MNPTSIPTTATVLVLGTGEIARSVARLAVAAGYPVRVCDPRAGEFRFPDEVETVDKMFADDPWQLPDQTHAIVARGHEGDPDSVATLLNHNAHRVYLVASRKRAAAVIDAALPALADRALLDRLSAPAGIDLGGNGSADIALSILAEIQWREHGGSLEALTDVRARRPVAADADRRDAPWRHDDSACPGKRP